MTYLPQEDYLVNSALQRGGYPKLYTAYGYVATSTTLKPVAAPGNFVTQLSNATATVESSDANDTAAGAGAQIVTLNGFKLDGTEYTETISMNGTTPVTSSNSYARIQPCKTYVSRTGGNQGDITNCSSVSAQYGTITIKKNSGVVPTYATIPYETSFSGWGQCNGAWYICPPAKTAVITNIRLQVAGGSDYVSFLFFLRPDFTQINTPTITYPKILAKYINLPAGLYNLQDYFKLSALGEFWISAIASANTPSVTAKFDILEYDSVI